MKSAIVYSPYWDTEGGGEKYTASVINTLIKLGYKVDVVWSDQSLGEKIWNKFNLDISQANIEREAVEILNKPGMWWKKWMLAKEYDFCFWVSDGSIPWGMAKRNILHFQIPFRLENVGRMSAIKLKTYKAVVCNSIFTKKVIDHTFGCRSLVIYPPVTRFPILAKRKLILSVGRFDSPSHNKRHDVMIEAFRRLGIGDWELVIAGGLLNKNEDIAQLQTLAKGYKITFMENPSFETMKKLYGEASVYWHAAGYGADLVANPEKAEHFGIATAEAMTAGAVPVVFKGGGQTEIISEGVNGYLWDRIEELSKKSVKLINAPDLRQKLSQRAHTDALVYSQEEFERHFANLIS
jgi:glycosyltransferase involved in cell wall biosynthesis